MASHSLALTDPSILAEFISQDTFKAFFEKRLEVPPDHVGLLMKNGQFVEAYTGAHLSVGGLFNQLKGVIGGSTAISLLVADMKPFTVKFAFGSVTRDHVQIAGEATVELQVDPERPGNIIGMMKGRSPLPKAEIADRIRPHVSDRAFDAAISRIDAAEIRGNTGLQDMVQADVMKIVESVLGSVGMLINSVSIVWGLNEIERKEIERAAALRQAEEAEFRFASAKRDIEREQESTVIRITNKTDLDKLNLQSGADLERLVLDQELSFQDARETGQRIQELKALEHEVTLLKSETRAKLDEALTKVEHTVDVREIEERRRVVERASEFLDREHGLRLRALERDFDYETREKNLEIQRIEKAAEDERRRRELEIAEKERDFKNEGRLEEVKVSEKEIYSKIDLQMAADKAALKKLEGLQGLENDMERERLKRRIEEGDALHKRAIEEKKLAGQQEEARLHLAAKMTSEQILAINAGLSPDVARVLAEQARAKATANEDVMKIMREMVDAANNARVQSEEQARAMFQMGMQGAVGVAAGAGAGVKAAAGIGEAEEADVECPNCGRTNDAKTRFCRGCGHQLRT